MQTRRSDPSKGDATIALSTSCYLSLDLWGAESLPCQCARAIYLARTASIARPEDCQGGCNRLLDNHLEIRIDKLRGNNSCVILLSDSSWDASTTAEQKPRSASPLWKYSG